MRKILSLICAAVMVTLAGAACASAPPDDSAAHLGDSASPADAPVPEETGMPDNESSDGAAPTAEPEAEQPVDLPPKTADFNDITASQWVSAVRAGWNLGNTFDAHAGHGAEGWGWIGDGTYAGASAAQMESAWVNHETTKELIDALYQAGFNGIRIPVTWFKACDDELNIREDWIERVAEVVDWALDNGMYVILNTHHDEELFKFMDADMEQSIPAFVRIWEQIAVHFRDYGERLAFEALNEPRTPGSNREWSGGTPEEHNNINIYSQSFVDTVRASGGNNAERILILTTYAASTEAAAQRGFVLPNDTIDDRLIVSLHMYSPWEFALRVGATGTRDEWDSSNPNDTDPITRPLELAHELFVQQGIPVIIGEMGALNRDNLDARVAWAEFYFSFAKSLGMPCFWWDNGMAGVTSPNDWGGWDETFGLISRSTAELEHPEIVETIMMAVE